MASTLTCGTDLVEVSTGGLPEIDALAAEWEKLCSEASNDEVFYRPGWIRAWLRSFAPGRKLVLLTCRCDGRLTGVLPLIAGRERFCGLPARTLHSASNAHSCRFDLLRASGPEGDRAVAAIWRHLAAMPGWDLLQFSDVPEGGALLDMAALAARQAYPTGRTESMRTPVLALAPGAREPWFAETTAQFRADLRRKARRFAEKGEVEFRHLRTDERQWLDAFYGLEGSGWKGAAGSAIGCSPETQSFYDEIAALAARSGWLSLYFLLCASKPVAAQYGLTYGGRFFMPKIAFDEAYKPYGPGHLLIERVLRDCFERGLSEYDFTGPSGEYKLRWARTVVPHYFLYIFRNSVYGRVLHATKFVVRAGAKRIAGVFGPAAGAPGENDASCRPLAARAALAQAGKPGSSREN